MYGFESKLNVFVNGWGSVVTWPPSTNTSTMTTRSGHAGLQACKPHGSSDSPPSPKLNQQRRVHDGIRPVCCHRPAANCKFPGVRGRNWEEAASGRLLSLSNDLPVV